MSERLTDEHVAEWVVALTEECLTNVGTEMLKEIQAEGLARGRERDEAISRAEAAEAKLWWLTKCEYVRNDWPTNLCRCGECRGCLLAAELEVE